MGMSEAFRIPVSANEPIVGIGCGQRGLNGLQCENEAN